MNILQDSVFKAQATRVEAAMVPQAVSLRLDSRDYCVPHIHQPYRHSRPTCDVIAVLDCYFPVCQSMLRASRSENRRAGGEKTTQVQTNNVLVVMLW